VERTRKEEMALYGSQQLECSQKRLSAKITDSNMFVWHQNLSPPSRPEHDPALHRRSLPVTTHHLCLRLVVPDSCSIIPSPSWPQSVQSEADSAVGFSVTSPPAVSLQLFNSNTQIRSALTYRLCGKSILVQLWPQKKAVM
jgi:hypothetical protein